MATHLAGILAAADWGVGAYPTSLISWKALPAHLQTGMRMEVAVDCGWGKLMFGQTFSSHERLIELFEQEQEGRRDIAMYVADPHILVAKAPGLLFIDPSVTYRLWLHPSFRQPDPSRKYRIRLLQSAADAAEVNALYLTCGLMPSDPLVIRANQLKKGFVYFLAEDAVGGRIVGSVMGVDHREAFGDPDNGASLWSLVVHRNYRAWGIGRHLVQHLAAHYLTRGRSYLDLSVLYHNQKAIRLYESLGFCRIPVYAVKRRNRINRHLYQGGEKT